MGFSFRKSVKAEKPKNPLIELLLCLLLGWAGAHRFYQKKIGWGIAYLLTFGAFCIGWWGDLIQLAITFFGKKNGTRPSRSMKIASYILAFLFTALLGFWGSSGSGTTAEETLPDSYLASQPTEVAIEEVTEEISEPTTEVINETICDVTTEPSAAAVGVAATEESTEANTEPETESTAEPSTEPSTEPTTEPTTESTTEPTTEPTTESTTEPTTESTTEPTKETVAEVTYIGNRNSKKFHKPGCSSVDSMKESNKRAFYGTRDEVIAAGYEPCGRCKP